MNLAEYLKQEAGIRPAVHFHDGIWWRKTSPGGCQPLYALQEIVPGSARPNRFRSFIRYSHVVPATAAAQARRTRPRLIIQDEQLRNYSLEGIADRKRRQAINKAARCGVTIDLIRDLEPHRRDLHEIYMSNAMRNRHGLPEQWYLDHEEEWWRDLAREFSLAGREWFGAFQGGKLVSFLYVSLVEDTAIMRVAKANKEHLVSDPNDLLWFEMILHYQKIPACRRIDAGWAIHVPPTIDWRKRSLGFEPIELPIFDRTNGLAMGLMRGTLFVARPLLNSSASGANRGFLFKAKTIQKRLEDLTNDG